MCIDLWQGKWKMDVRTKKVLYARIRTHIFKAPSAPECTKIAARVRVRAHARTLRVWFYRIVFTVLVWQIIWCQTCDCLFWESFSPLCITYKIMSLSPNCLYYRAYRTKYRVICIVPAETILSLEILRSHKEGSRALLGSQCINIMFEEIQYA